LNHISGLEAVQRFSYGIAADTYKKLTQGLTRLLYLMLTFRQELQSFFVFMQLL